MMFFPGKGQKRLVRGRDHIQRVMWTTVWTYRYTLNDVDPLADGHMIDELEWVVK